MRRSLVVLSAVSALFTAPLWLGAGFPANAGDLYDYAAPFRAWGARETIGGRLPFWNPWIFGGAPFLASPQSALFYPLNNVGIAWNTAPFYRTSAVVHLALLSLGFWLWLRARGVRGASALTGASMGAFSFFLMAKVSAGHVIHLMGYAWTPYVLLLGEDAVRRPGRPAAPWALGAASALQFVSGHLQVWLVTHAVLAGLLAGPRLFRPRALRPLAWAALVVLGLTGVQAFPTALYLPRTSRGLSDALNEADRYAFATSYSMTPSRLWRGWLRPGAWGPLPAARRFPEPRSVYFETATVFAGRVGLAVAFAGLGLWLARRRFRETALALGGLLLALGKNGPVYPLLWKALAFLRVPARFYLATHVVLAAAAARGVSAVKNRRWAVVLFFAVVGELYAVGRPFLRTEDPGSRLERTELLAWLGERVAAPGGPRGRVFTHSSVGAHNKGMLVGLPNLNGYEALVPGAPWREIARGQPGVVQPTTGMDLGPAEDPLLSALGLRYLVIASSDGPRWPEVWRSGALTVRENPAWRPTLTVEGGRVVAEWRPRADGARAVIRHTGPARAIWTETADPGWRAWAEGRELPVRALRGVAQAVDLAPGDGTSRLRWRYRPPGFLVGLFAALAAVAAAAVAAGAAARRMLLRGAA